MFESPEFIASLNHTNPERPRFTIGTGMDARVLIEFNGQSLAVPIAEILKFARRWEADFERQRAKEKQAGRLGLFPYPLYGTRLDDPDRSSFAPPESDRGPDAKDGTDAAR